MARREVTGKKPGVTADLIDRDDGPPDPDDDEPTRHRDPTARHAKALPPIRGPPDQKVADTRPPPLRLAMSIPEFCYAHSISEDFYFKLKRQNEGPDEMAVGARTLISVEAAAAWRRKREAVAKETAARKRKAREQAGEREATTA